MTFSKSCIDLMMFSSCREQTNTGELFNNTSPVETNGLSSGRHNEHYTRSFLSKRSTQENHIVNDFKKDIHAEHSNQNKNRLTFWQQSINSSIVTTPSLFLSIFCQDTKMVKRSVCSFEVALFMYVLDSFLAFRQSPWYHQQKPCL